MRKLTRSICLEDQNIKSSKTILSDNWFNLIFEEKIAVYREIIEKGDSRSVEVEKAIERMQGLRDFVENDLRLPQILLEEEKQEKEDEKQRKEEQKKCNEELLKESRLSGAYKSFQ